MTYELTGGITDQISLGFMQLNGVIPGTGFQYGRWRVLAHFYAPESRGLPVDVRLVVVRPIIEKKLGDFQVDFNPMFARALCGKCAKSFRAWISSWQRICCGASGWEPG
jgi:hypothetical protein